ncbi:spore protease YyaC [uncultured Tyzzerella sp.]|uniref:spore protease YyaC n=1 Tax=uncultured Tyzzerella sp. TaxID=2321398 RepID=UPI002942A206|nr:spore protease YyaC [uncultured Tyzzerella sp.]
MNNILINKKNISNYIDATSKFALLEFKDSLFTILYKYKNDCRTFVFLCIGSDRATGDSLGPLVGYKLSKLPLNNNIFVYGTLEKTVNAKNLKETIEQIYISHKNPLVIAVDASLGSREYINYINVGEGSIKPGAGAKKNLPYIGDIFITGIVNHTGILEISVLQNTKLSIVMNMADIITSGIWHCISSI